MSFRGRPGYANHPIGPRNHRLPRTGAAGLFECPNGGAETANAAGCKHRSVTPGETGRAESYRLGSRAPFQTAGFDHSAGGRWPESSAFSEAPGKARNDRPERRPRAGNAGVNGRGFSCPRAPAWPIQPPRPTGDSWTAVTGRRDGRLLDMNHAHIGKTPLTAGKDRHLFDSRRDGIEPRKEQ